MPKKTIILAPSRSGTTPVEHSLDAHPDVTTLDNSLKRKYIRYGKTPEYELYDLMDQVRTKVALCKMSFGMGSAAHCTYDPFPSDEVVGDLNLIFVMRDPVQTANSWKRYKNRDVSLLPLAYENTLHLMNRVRNLTAQVMSTTYEKFTENPEVFIKKWCSQVGIEFKPEMLNWQHEVAGRTKKESQLHETLQNSTGIKHVERKIELTDEERKIAESLYDQYYLFQDEYA